MIRKYQESDFLQVMDLLQRSCAYDDITEALLKEKLYGDPAWDPRITLVAEERGTVIGFMQGVTRDIRGEKYAYLKLFAVDPAHRRRGVAREMLQNLEDHFRARACSYFRLMDVPLNYLMPGIDPRYTEALCFALNSGFEHKGNACNMSVDLDGRSWATAEDTERLARENIEIRRARESDMASLLDLIRAEWSLWEHEVTCALLHPVPAVFIALKNGRVLAFAAYDGNNAGTGWFGPMGTAKDLRGKGIGGILLYLCLNDLRNAGLHKATIPWVDPVCFYSHYADARIDRVFWRFEKKL
ncbi:MAG: GNAT family N-acetyltransferase [Bacteroidota bacterium]